MYIEQVIQDKDNIKANGEGKNKTKQGNNDNDNINDNNNKHHIHQKLKSCRKNKCPCAHQKKQNGCHVGSLNSN